jgi:hypothetical protein
MLEKKEYKRIGNKTNTRNLCKYFEAINAKNTPP